MHLDNFELCMLSPLTLKDESLLGIVAIAGYKSLIKRGSTPQPGPNSDGQAE